MLREMIQSLINHFMEFRGAKAGVGNGSCCAVMKITDTEFVYGQSQAFKLDQDAMNPDSALFDPANHAERVVIQIAQGKCQELNASLPKHLFVELPPCGGPKGCHTWLANNQDLPNDFNVWYFYEATKDMVSWHSKGAQLETDNILSALPL